MSSKPGKKWIYCSGTPHLLSAVLQKETGIDARNYANQNLFASLGILQISEQDWASDPKGITNGIAGLYLTPRSPWTVLHAHSIELWLCLPQAQVWLSQLGARVYPLPVA